MEASIYVLSELLIESHPAIASYFYMYNMSIYKYKIVITYSNTWNICN